jgi:hypothetical protein
MKFRVLYVVLGPKINHSPDYTQWMMENNPGPGDHEKLEILKRTFLQWRPMHSLTPEYWIFMEVSDTLGVFGCVATGVVSK